MRILIWADGGANTGYGTVTHNLASRWVAMGAEVHVLAINYLGDPFPASYHLYPASKGNLQDRFGINRLLEMVNRVKPDVMFILNDLYIITQALKPFNNNFPVPTVLYVPIDGTAVPNGWVEPIRKANRTVVMSNHGRRTLMDEWHLPTQVIWHGVEHELFFPLSEEKSITAHRNGQAIPINSKTLAKKELGIAEDRFVWFAVNRNSIRKNYPDLFRVFDRFRKKYPKALLYLHTAKVDEGGDLGLLSERYGLTQEHLMLYDPKDTFLGSPKTLLALMYNAADVKVSTSMAEGFGLTDAEALACGVPVVAQEYSATTEVVANGGITVPPQRHFTTANMVDFALPDLDGYFDALEKLYLNPELRAELSRNAVSHAAHFSWDKAATEFMEIFNEVAAQKPVGR